MSKEAKEILDMVLAENGLAKNTILREDLILHAMDRFADKMVRESEKKL